MKGGRSDRERVLFDANEEQRGVGKGIGIYQLI